jgi:hypothetical protein
MDLAILVHSRVLTLKMGKDDVNLLHYISLLESSIDITPSTPFNLLSLLSYKALAYRSEKPSIGSSMRLCYFNELETNSIGSSLITYALGVTTR